MAGAALHLPDSQYLAAVDRVEEMARLQAQAQRRQSMLVFGPEGAGKTRLLLAFAETQPLALYVAQIRSPREFLLSLVRELRRRENRELRLPANAEALSTASLKGVVRGALAEFPFMLVIDHLAGPSRVVSGLIREFSDYGKRPIYFAARSPHMEDIGALQGMCADRSERLELKNLSPAIALEFGRREAERGGLRAANLEAALRSIVEWSGGNPGSILQMLQMAHLPGYRMGDQIKAHVLWLDYRMGRRPPV
jgi:hypothetical protein